LRSAAAVVCCLDMCLCSAVSTPISLNYLEECSGSRVERAVRMHQGIMSCDARELVGCWGEVEAGHGGQAARDSGVEPPPCVETCMVREARGLDLSAQS
jgi:hypothetical protein